MVAAEMLEEKRKKAEEEDMFDDIGAEAGQVMVVAMMTLLIKMTFRRRRCFYPSFNCIDTLLVFSDMMRFTFLLQAGLGKKKKRVPVIAD